jgi:hypothetical protein
MRTMVSLVALIAAVSAASAARAQTYDPAYHVAEGGLAPSAAASQSMIPKSGNRFSGKIMLQQEQGRGAFVARRG